MLPPLLNVRQLPRRRPKKGQQSRIQRRIQTQPPNDRGNTVVIESDDKPHNNDDEPVECRRSAETVFKQYQNQADLVYHDDAPQCV